MDCDCFTKAKKALNENNMEFIDLDLAFDMNGNSAIVVSVKMMKGKQKKRKQILLNYCPFCGKEIKRKDVEASKN